MEFLKIFDCAAVTECYQRKESIVPQQALALANSEWTFVQARIIARQLHQSCGTDDVGFVKEAFKRVLSRVPTADETITSLAFFIQQNRTLSGAKEGLVQASVSEADTSNPASDPNLRVRENFVHVLLNHNDFVTIR
jgi:hypothetical protein